MLAPLDSAPLARAIDRLAEGLARHRQAPGDEQLRDGLIQRYEFTFELGHRLVRRTLKQEGTDPDAVDAMSFAELVRAGGASGLLGADWAAWRRFRDLRARSSHTYDAAVAATVIAAIPEFLAEARHLLAALRRRAP